MPNWCYNSVSINGPTKVLKQIQNEVKDKGFLESVDPTPQFLKEIHTGGASAIDPETGEKLRVTKWIEKEVDGETVKYALSKEQKEHLMENYGTDDISWYQWNIQNRGTKWEETNLDYSLLEEELKGELDDPNSICLYFDTAWGPCEPIIPKAVKKWGVGVRLEYFEEAGQCAGVLEYCPSPEGEPQLVKEDYFEDLDEMIESGIDFIVDEAQSQKEWLEEC